MLTAKVTVHRGHDADPLYWWEVYRDGEVVAFADMNAETEEAAMADLDRFIREVSTHGIVVEEMGKAT